MPNEQNLRRFIFSGLLFVVCISATFLVASRVSASGNLQPTAINLNTATPEQLALLPGLGRKKSAAIVKFREKHGRFQSIEDIQGVKGPGAVRK